MGSGIQDQKLNSSSVPNNNYYTYLLVTNYYSTLPTLSHPSHPTCCDDANANAPGDTNTSSSLIILKPEGVWVYGALRRF